MTNELDKQIINVCGWCGARECAMDKCRIHELYNGKDQECERLKEGYAELTEIVTPFIDDFTGYNEELGGFDIVLCVKELMEQLDQLQAENEHLNVQLESCFIGEKELFEQLNQAKAELELYKRSKQVSYEEMQRRWNEVEQENRQLKRQHQGDKGLITSTGKMNYQLLQEYDKLKEEKQGLIKDWEEKKNLAYEIACKNEKLKQTLTEIKEIASKVLLNTHDLEQFKDADALFVSLLKIHKKISECEVE